MDNREARALSWAAERRRAPERSMWRLRASELEAGAAKEGPGRGKRREEKFTQASGRRTCDTEIETWPRREGLLLRDRTSRHSVFTGAVKGGSVH
jgi:hypothetical protein